MFSMVTAEACGQSRHFIESKTESEKEWSSNVPGRDEGSSAGAPPPSHLSVQFLESRRREACGYNYRTIIRKMTNKEEKGKVRRKGRRNERWEREGEREGRSGGILHVMYLHSLLVVNGLLI